MPNDSKTQQFFPGNLGSVDPAVRKTIELLYERVNYLIVERDRLSSLVTDLEKRSFEGGRRQQGLEISLASVQDALTQGSTFAGEGTTTLNPTTQISGGSTGYSFSQSSEGILTMTVASQAGARAAINAAVNGAPAGAPATVTLFKITGGGTDGSLTIGVDGTITAFVAPT